MRRVLRKNIYPSTIRTNPIARSKVQAQVGSYDPLCRVCGNLRMPFSQDRSFITLLDAYRPHGGLSRLHHLKQTQSGGADIDIERLVREGQLCAFQWHHDMWVPLFQLELNGHALATAPQRIVAEFDRGFDGWELANWFIQPNAWLGCHSPIEWLNSHLPEVLQAARADRFFATV